MADPQIERLIINNFLSISSLDIEVGRVTVLIGPQASGKSTIAKLLHFFRTFLGRQFAEHIDKEATKKAICRDGIAAFERTFPAYAWRDSPFTISYTYGEFGITLKQEKRAGKTLRITLECSEALLEFYGLVLADYKKRKKSLRASQDSSQIDSDLRTQRETVELFWEMRLVLQKQAPVFRGSIFIPASRSFFATLQKSVFSFLANNIPIDPLIKEFGALYENAKSNFVRRIPTSRSADPRRLDEANALRLEFSHVLMGEYNKQGDQDWIVSKEGRVNLTNASSGQQESLPMLVVLADRMRSSNQLGPLYFVEEPEAHLFPVSQRKLVDIFSRLYAKFNYQILLTTHSPYILTALNNLVYASNLLEGQDEAVGQKVRTILGSASPIRFSDLRAYTIDKGAAVNIVDGEARLIGSSVIDCVSADFESVFDQLLALESELGN